MDVREKLVEILKQAPFEGKVLDEWWFEEKIKRIADHLIAHSVTVQELDGCFRCKDVQEMTVTISNKLINCVNTGWLGGNLPARYCPFCGRRLPQPPKGE